MTFGEIIVSESHNNADNLSWEDDALATQSNHVVLYHEPDNFSIPMIRNRAQ